MTRKKISTKMIIIQWLITQQRAMKQTKKRDIINSAWKTGNDWISIWKGIQSMYICHNHRHRHRNWSKLAWSLILIACHYTYKWAHTMRVRIHFNLHSIVFCRSYVMFFFFSIGRFFFLFLFSVILFILFSVQPSNRGINWSKWML